MRALGAVLAALLLWAGPAAASSHSDIPAAARAREAALLAKASPAVKAWVREEGQRLRKAGGVSESAVQAAARARFGSLGGVGDGDIMAIAFLVMMDAAKSAQEDLKATMAEVKSMNAAKTRQRAALDRQKDQRDSLSDLSQEQQLKMQMVMERHNKAVEALSNLMKKMSETQSSIIGNLK